jgi:hypothetical protein
MPEIKPEIQPLTPEQMKTHFGNYGKRWRASLTDA